MDRRTFNKLAGLTALAALTENMELSAEQAAAITGDVVLQDKDLLVAFDPASGALTRMEHKPTKWVIERRPALGVSFRMHAPLPTQRTNFIFGQKQRAKSVEKIYRQPGPNPVGKFGEPARRRSAHHVHGHRHAQKRRTHF